MSRNSLLQLSDADLLKLCEIFAYRGSGPGGQHRNKTSTGVELRLMSSDKCLVVYSCDDRSSHINKLLALRKLRLKIALQIREEPGQIPFAFPGSNGRISEDNKLYPEFIADVLDRIKASSGDLSEAAKAWGLSKSALNKIILQNKKVLENFSAIRARNPAISRRESPAL
jgi:hypothetical protein